MRAAAIIDSMLAQNFLSFGSAEFHFREAGLTFVEGENQDDASADSNGSGKSAMIDALVWCLFGITLRGYENDEVVNRKIGEDCLVTVKFLPGDENVMYEVSRARKHKKLKNSLRVIQVDRGGDSTDLSGPSNAETQEIIEKLLGCSRRTFLSSVVFGQDRAYRFSSLTDKDQKEILDEVLGVERFAAACSDARLQLSEVTAALNSLQRDLERAEELQAQSAEEAEGLREKDASFEDDRAAKIKEQREKLTKAKDWVKKNAGDAGGDKLKTAAEKALTKVTSAEKVVTTINNEVMAARELRAGARTKLEELQKQVKKHEGLKGDCPTCGQRVDDLQHDNVLRDLKKKFITASKKLTQVDADVAEAQSHLDAAQLNLSDARSAARAAQASLNESVAESANLIAWKRRVKDHTDRIDELEKETNPYAALAKRVETKHEKYKKDVELLTEQVTGEEARAKLADFWVKAFGAKGLRSLLLDTSLPLLNEEAARVSRAVTGGTITIEFSATSDLKSGKTVDKFEVRVDNKHGAGTYQGNSAGERAKVDLCVGLALQRLVASRSSTAFNVCFFDEVFDHLDGAAHERVIDVLSEIDKESVFVISHNDDLKAWFPASLRIVKKGGLSRVEL